MSSPRHSLGHALTRGGRVLLLGASPALADRTAGALAQHAPEMALTVATAADEALAALGSLDCLAVGEDLDGWSVSAAVETVRERDSSLPVVALVDARSAALDTLLAAGVTDVVSPDAPGALLAARLGAAVGIRSAAGRDTDSASETGEATTHGDPTSRPLDAADRGGVPVEPLGDGTVTHPDARHDRTELLALRAELDSVRDSLRGLYAVTTDASLSLDERIERTLALACEWLDVEVGFVTRITDDTQRIVHAVGDHPLLQPGEVCPLSESYCRRTLDTEGLLAVGHAAVDDEWADDPGYELFGLESYLGAKLNVGDELYGTLCFADTDPRDEPFTESQTVFVELLTRWVSYELERKRDARDLRTATRRFRALFDNPRTFAGILDTDGTLREANETARSTLSADDSVLGRPFWETRWWTPDEESVEAVREAVETAATGEVASFECAYFHREGSGTVGVTIYPVFGVPEDDLSFDERDDGDSEIVSLMAIGSDTTTRTEQAAQLRRQHDRLDEFASVVSHDLRSPLEVARGRLHLYEQTGEAENIEQAKRSIDRMSTLIDDLLDLARQGAVVSDSVSLSVAEVAHRAWSTVETGDGTLTVDLDTALTVEADPTRIRQLFENLFRNSVEHGSTDDNPATVRLVALDGGRGFAVEDDGAGIDPADRPQIFERGFTTATEGTGFGLAIVARIVEAHGWRIDVTEGAAGGARFEVCVEPDGVDA